MPFTRLLTKIASLCLYPLVSYCQAVLSLLRVALGHYFAPPTDVNAPEHHDASTGGKQTLHISWPGLGIFFWWQLGALRYLQQHFDLSTVPMIGSSAGSFIATFAACGTPPDAILDSAISLCHQHNVFTRPLGLLGVWGRIIRQWLDSLLPPTAHLLASRATSIVVTTLPALQRHVVSNFTSREDLINACAASAHIPFFLDLQPWAWFRGVRCLDGGFRYVVLRTHRDLHPDGAAGVLVMDARRDAELMSSFGLQQCVSCLSPEGGRRLMQRGYEYMSQLHASGGLDRFDLDAIQLPAAAPGAAEPDSGAAVAASEPAGAGAKDAGVLRKGAGRTAPAFNLVASSRQSLATA